MPWKRAPSCATGPLLAKAIRPAEPHRIGSVNFRLLETDSQTAGPPCALSYPRSHAQSLSQGQSKPAAPAAKTGFRQSITSNRDNGDCRRGQSGVALRLRFGDLSHSQSGRSDPNQSNSEMSGFSPTPALRPHRSPGRRETQTVTNSDGATAMWRKGTSRSAKIVLLNPSRELFLRRVSFDLQDQEEGL